MKCNTILREIVIIIVVAIIYCSINRSSCLTIGEEGMNEQIGMRLFFNKNRKSVTIALPLFFLFCIRRDCSPTKGWLNTFFSIFLADLTDLLGIRFFAPDDLTLIRSALLFLRTNERTQDTD